MSEATVAQEMVAREEHKLRWDSGAAEAAQLRRWRVLNHFQIKLLT